MRRTVQVPIKLKQCENIQNNKFSAQSQEYFLVKPFSAVIILAQMCVHFVYTVAESRWLKGFV